MHDLIYDGQWPDSQTAPVITQVTQDPVVTKVRYPPRPGHELSVLIQHGYPALFRPRPNLRGWLDHPPMNEDIQP